MPTKTVSVHDAETNLTELINQALRGEDVVIAEADKPLVRLTPVSVSSSQQRVAGLNRGEIWVSDDFDESLPDEFWLGS